MIRQNNLMDPKSDFGRVAALYARVRPGYLPQVFDDLITLGGLPKGGSVLEIGPGTGQATRPLAERGYGITGVEPDAAMAEQARRQLAEYSGVTIEVSTFEAWPLRPGGFDLVLAATAWHWVDPAVGYAKATAALKPGGTLAIINTHHVAGGTQAFFEDAQVCYVAHMPDTPAGFRLPPAAAVEPGTNRLIGSGLFEAPVVRRYESQETYSTSQYVDLISTYSNHLALSAANRTAFNQCIAGLIDGRFDGQVVKAYMTELIVAKKRRA